MYVLQSASQGEMAWSVLIKRVTGPISGVYLLTLILAAVLLGHCVAAFSYKCLPEEVETATSRPE